MAGTSTERGGGPIDAPERPGNALSRAMRGSDPTRGLLPAAVLAVGAVLGSYATSIISPLAAFTPIWAAASLVPLAAGPALGVVLLLQLRDQPWGFVTRVVVVIVGAGMVLTAPAPLVVGQLMVDARHDITRAQASRIERGGSSQPSSMAEAALAVPLTISDTPQGVFIARYPHGYRGWCQARLEARERAVGLPLQWRCTG